MPSEAIHERLLALQKQLTFVTAVNNITNKESTLLVCLLAKSV